MKRSLHNLIWLSSSLFLILFVAYCFYLQIFSFDLSPIRFIWLIIHSVPFTIFIALQFLIPTISTKIIPDFRLSPQILTLHVYLILSLNLYDNLWKYNYIQQNQSFSLINLELLSLKMYENYPHKVYDWDKIKSSYVKKEYKEFVKFHQNFNRPKELIADIFQISNKTSLSQEEVLYLQALVINVANKDVINFINENLTLQQAEIFKQFWFKITSKGLINE
jgi:hypothetical protein